MNFFTYFLRRLLLVIPLLLGITVVAFIVANAVPADPINVNLPVNALNNEALVEAFRKKWGLDKPPHEQYFTYLGNLLQGDMGVSIKTRKPIREDIARFLPATIELASLGIVFGSFFGVSLGLISAVWKDSIADYFARVAALDRCELSRFSIGAGLLDAVLQSVGHHGGTGTPGFHYASATHRHRHVHH